MSERERVDDSGEKKDELQALWRTWKEYERQALSLLIYVDEGTGVPDWLYRSRDKSPAHRTGGINMKP